jgi:hypothetical protein
MPRPVATRPLWMQRVSGSYNFFYFHDGNKNVSDLVSYQSARGVPAHYEYAPFGAVTAATTNTAFNVGENNPYRFSSEYANDALDLVDDERCEKTTFVGILPARVLLYCINRQKSRCCWRFSCFGNFPQKILISRFRFRFAGSVPA